MKAPPPLQLQKIVSWLVTSLSLFTSRDQGLDFQSGIGIGIGIAWREEKRIQTSCFFFVYFIIC